MSAFTYRVTYEDGHQSLLCRKAAINAFFFSEYERSRESCTQDFDRAEAKAYYEREPVELKGTGHRTVLIMRKDDT